MFIQNYFNKLPNYHIHLLAIFWSLALKTAFIFLCSHKRALYQIVAMWSKHGRLGLGGGVLLVILKISSQLPLLSDPSYPWDSVEWLGPLAAHCCGCHANEILWQEFSWCLFICRSNGNCCSGRALGEKREGADCRGQWKMYCVWFPVLNHFLALLCKYNTLFPQYQCLNSMFLLD